MANHPNLQAGCSIERKFNVRRCLIHSLCASTEGRRGAGMNGLGLQQTIRQGKGGNIMTSNSAKKIIKTWMEGKGMDYKLTARTIDFTDLARSSCIFVKVHGWQPDPSWDELTALAKSYGFRVETGS